MLVLWKTIKSHASMALKTRLSCMRNKLPLLLWVKVIKQILHNRLPKLQLREVLSTYTTSIMLLRPLMISSHISMVTRTFTAGKQILACFKSLTLTTIVRVTITHSFKQRETKLKKILRKTERIRTSKEL